MTGRFGWICPICGAYVSGRTRAGRGLSRSNHLRVHGIFTTWLTPEEKENDKFLKGFDLLLRSGLNYYNALDEVRKHI
jgi:hypothetical protein